MQGDIKKKRNTACREDQKSEQMRKGNREKKIRVNSGIKQGCTSSTIWFKLITYRIIIELERRGVLLKIGEFSVTVIWHTS